MDSSWSGLHKKYKGESWSRQPSIFAQTAIKYFPKGGKLLELGAGLGQDSIYFAKNGYQVTSSDIEITELKLLEKTNPKSLRVLKVDLRRPLPFEDSTFDVIYAHLSLHYFSANITSNIFQEAYRVLRPGGSFAFLVNSTSDPEYGTGKKIEEDFFKVDGKDKRYFISESVESLVQDFKSILLDQLGETYKDKEKGVHNLIRFIGRKRSSQ